MEDKEKLKSKARKLKALANRGEGGEKETSQRMYDEFIKKHSLDESEIDPSLNNRKFRVKNYDDSLILTNVILSVNPFTKITQHELRTDCNLDWEDYNEVKKKFAYFVKLYRIEKELLNMAFFSKHSKFFQPDEDVQKKWRESKAENNDLKKARENAEKLNSNKDSKSVSKEDQIMLMNLKRMGLIQEHLLDAEYIKTKKTIEQ